MYVGFAWIELIIQGTSQKVKGKNETRPAGGSGRQSLAGLTSALIFLLPSSFDQLVQQVKERDTREDHD
jgi:hypothetical protein